AGSLDLADRAAQRSLGLVTATVGDENTLGGALDGRLGLGLGLGGLLGGGDELDAAVALLKDTLRATGRRLAQLAGAGPPDATGARDGEAVEVVRHVGERVDDPDAGQQTLGERRGRRVGLDP